MLWVWGKVVLSPKFFRPPLSDFSAGSAPDLDEKVNDIFHQFCNSRKEVIFKMHVIDARMTYASNYSMQLQNVIMGSVPNYFFLITC